MISLYWFAYSDANCPYYTVYRAITGFKIPFPNVLSISDKLIFSATGSDQQTINFSAVDIDSVAATINALGKGVIATKSQNNSYVFVRCLAREKARLKLFNSSFLAHTGLTPTIVVPALVWESVGTVNRLDNTFNYSFTDPDGHPLDWYRVTSMGSPESIPSIEMQPFIPLQLMCVLEGRLTDAQNNPAEYAEVIAKLDMIENNSVTQAMIQSRITTKTDKYGRFSMPLVRCQTYLLQVPAYKYNEKVTMPDQDMVNLLNLVPTTVDSFSPFGDPDGAGVTETGQDESSW